MTSANSDGRQEHRLCSVGSAPSITPDREADREAAQRRRGAAGRPADDDARRRSDQRVVSARRSPVFERPHCTVGVHARRLPPGRRRGRTAKRSPVFARTPSMRAVRGRPPPPASAARSRSPSRGAARAASSADRGDDDRDDRHLPARRCRRSIDRPVEATRRDAAGSPRVSSRTVDDERDRSAGGTRPRTSSTSIIGGGLRPERPEDDAGPSRIERRDDDREAEHDARPHRPVAACDANASVNAPGHDRAARRRS